MLSSLSLDDFDKKDPLLDNKSDNLFLKLIFGSKSASPPSEVRSISLDLPGFVGSLLNSEIMCFVSNHAGFIALDVKNLVNNSNLFFLHI